MKQNINKPSIKWVDTSKPRKTLDNMTFKDDIIHPAHSLERVGFAPYVNRRWVIKILKEWQEENSVEATQYLKELGEPREGFTDQ